MTAPTITVKRCPRCGETKSVDGFSRNRSRRDGLNSQCKECRRAYREAHREETRSRERAYREAHREERNARNRAYWNAHREEKRAYNRERNAMLGNPHRNRWQEITRKHATRLRDPWSEAEDRYLAASTERAVDDALALGRTYTSVQYRICDLRARGVTLARDAH